MLYEEPSAFIGLDHSRAGAEKDGACMMRRYMFALTRINLPGELATASL